MPTGNRGEVLFLETEATPQLSETVGAVRLTVAVFVLASVFTEMGRGLMITGFVMSAIVVMTVVADAVHPDALETVAI